MRKTLPVWIFLLTLLIPSCGPITPTPVVETLPPSPASLSGPVPEEAVSDIPTTQTSLNQIIRFEHFSLEEGLSQSVVTAILQDQRGFLWIGTEDGLNRYDGYTFKVYKPDANDPYSLSDRWITALTEDENGYLWVGTRLGGLNRFDPVTGKFTRFLNSQTDKTSISSNRVTALFPDETGLWVGTDDGLNFHEYNSPIFTRYQMSAEGPLNLSSNSISAIYRDSSGLLWIGTANAGLDMYNKITGSFQVYKSDETDISTISNNRVLSIAEGKYGEVWVGTANGLNRFDASQRNFQRFTNSTENEFSIASNMIYAIYRDRSGRLWLGTSNGLDHFDEQTGRFLHYKHEPNVTNSLSNDMVFSVYEDRNHVLWAGTFGGGLNKYNHQQDKFRYYRNDPKNPNSLGSNFVVPMIVDSNGFVWIGTSGAGLDKFDPMNNLFTHYRADLSNPYTINSDDITSLYIDHKDNLWIGTTRGLDRFDPVSKTFKHFQQGSNAGSMSNPPVYSILEDSQNKLWVGTSHSLDLFNPDTQTFSNFEVGTSGEATFSGSMISALFEDNKGNLWVGTFDNGLKRINTERTAVTQYVNDQENPSSLSNNSILSIYQDKNGILWVGTMGGGLNRYNAKTDSFSQFTEKNGLPNNVIYGILEDKDETLWLSTNFGLSRFDPQTFIVRNFTTSDGLQSNEFNQNAFTQDKNGTMYFGGINGFNAFAPEDITADPIPPQVALTSITEDGNALSSERVSEYLQNITLTWPQNSFEFEFTALNFSQPNRNQYAYMLEGFDNSWKNIGTKRSGRYTNLPGGTYTLRLRAANSDGIWNEAGQSIVITVIPPFWNTWWFQSTLLLGLAMTFAGGLRWRVKSIQKRNRELESIVQKRTADLEKRTSEIEALYRADEKILRNVTINQVFQTLVDVAISLLQADRSVIFTWSEEHRRIIPRVSYGFRPETLKVLNFEEGEGMVGLAMRTGKPVIVPDLKLNDLRSDVQTVIHREGIQSYAHFPIVVDGKVVALFNVGYTRPNALNDNTLKLFTALVHRAALSIANMHLFEQTKDLAVMEERNRLARELHDSAKQKAFAALAQLGTANGILKGKSNGAQAHLSEAETLVYEVIQELTFLIQEIYPIALQEKGLPTTLREYIYEWENRNDATINLTVQNERKLPLDTEQAVYRVIQEALANVARHSKAKRAEIALVYNTDSLQITIADDGCGFDMNQKAKGMGLRSMRERIATVRGIVQIQSAPGQGTRVMAQLPIKNGTGD